MCHCCHNPTLQSPYTPNRRHFLDTLMAGGAALGLGSLPLTAGAADPLDDTVRIGYLPITDATALLLAHAEGYFKDEGLDAAQPTLIRGWSPLIEGFVGRKFNLVHFLKPIPIWMRYNTKFPVKITGWAHTNGSALVTGRHVQVNSFKELGGKQVAVPYWYSVHNIILQQALLAQGVTPVIQDASKPLKNTECNLQILPPPDMPAALAARKIDAYTVAEPFNALGELKAGAKMLRFTGDIWQNHPCCVVCMHEADTIEKPEWSQAVMNAIVKAQNFAESDPKEVAKIIAREGKGYLPAPTQVVDRAMTYYDANAYGNAIKHPQWDVERINFFGYPYPSATKKILTDLKQTLVAGDTTFLKNLDPDFVAQDLVNYDYIKKAIAQHSTNPKPQTRTEVFEL